MMKRLKWLLLCAATLLATGTALAVEHTKDSFDKVKQNLAEGKAVMLDVREKTEWDEGHLEKAKLLPYSEVRNLKNNEAAKTRVEKEVPKDKIIYCHCAAGVRALIVGNLLESLGYDVRPLEPGFEALRDAGFPTAKPEAAK